MSSPRSRTLASLALATACLVFVAGFEVASGHEYSARTQATIDSGGPKGAEGHVTSGRAACERHRKVKLFRERDGADEFFGSAFSDDEGAWEVVAALVQGNYYVVALAFSREISGHNHACRRAMSPVKHL